MEKPKANSAVEGWIMAKLDTMETLFNNHLSHHKKLSYILLTALLGLIISRFF